MIKKNQTTLKGAALAVAMAGMAGCHTTHDRHSATTPSASGSTDLIHCYGVNVCNGHNDCKTANNACGGHAKCKGTGYITMPSKSCGDIGGKVKDDWVGQVSQSELIQCYGINICNGHNDCKTANNACKGHASCEGTGFVMAPFKACKDAGGKISG